MASLTGNQINNTYVGLLKTDDNAAITGQIGITDGTGVSAGFAINPGNSEFLLTGNGTQNPRFTLTNAAANPTYIPFQGEDGVGGIKAQLNFDQYGSYNMISNVSTADPELIVQNLADGNAKIAINAYNSTNNSDNWFTGYNERITAGSFDGVTSNLTLTKPDGTDIVVNIPTGGGGGTPGFVAGTGSNAMKSADFLAQAGFPADASGADSLALVSYARATNTHAIAIGLSSQAAGNSSLAIGPGAIAQGIDSVGIGRSSQATGNNGLAIGANSRALASDAIGIGKQAYANATEQVMIGASVQGDAFSYTAVGIGQNIQFTSAEDSVYLGTNGVVNGPRSFNMGSGNQYNGTDGIILGSVSSIGAGNQRNLLMGHGTNGIAVPSGVNDYISIGRVQSPVGSASNTIAIGLLPQVTNSGDSVVIGRQSTLNGASSSVAIGRQVALTAPFSAGIGYNNTVSAQGAVAVGRNLTAAKTDTTTVANLEVATTGGSIIMKDSTGVEWTITVSTSGTLVVS